jgi:hypothetical protein
MQSLFDEVLLHPNAAQKLGIFFSLDDSSIVFYKNLKQNEVEKDIFYKLYTYKNTHVQTQLTYEAVILAVQNTASSSR